MVELLRQAGVVSAWTPKGWSMEAELALDARRCIDLQALTGGKR